MWYSRVESSKIQCGVNLLHQRNGENSNSSLFRILANEVDKQATYFQAERYQLDPSFCMKHFNFFHKLIKLELLDRIGERERHRTQQIVYIILCPMEYYFSGCYLVITLYVTLYIVYYISWNPSEFCLYSWWDLSL